MESIGGLVEDLKSATAKLAGEELAGLSDAEVEALVADVYAAGAQLRATAVAAVREVEVRRIHQADGHRSVATYLAHKLKIPKKAASGTARLAHRRWALPHTMAALASGVISEAHAQLIGRAYSPQLAVVFERDEPLMVEKAQELCFRDFAFFIEHWRDIADPDRGRDNADRAVRKRRAHINQTGDCIYLDAVGDIISGTTIAEALARIEDELFKADWAQARAEHGEDATAADLPRTPAQRRYDALVELAERAMAAPADGKRPEPLINIICDWATFQKALLELTGNDTETEYDLDSTSEMLDGTPITPLQAAEQALLGCVARVVFGTDNIIINAGRTRRFYTKRIRTLLATQHRTCTWPGCDIPATRCQTDHIQPWALGGPTNIGNARPRCTYHHRLTRGP